MNPRGKPAPPISAADFPALSNFLRGYFHEDMADEYGSPEGAVRRFQQDADSTERRAVAAEWKHLLKCINPHSLNAVNDALTKLGSGCTLENDADLKKVSAAFEGTMSAS
jgi:hypothetical protein